MDRIWDVIESLAVFLFCVVMALAGYGVFQVGFYLLHGRWW